MVVLVTVAAPALQMTSSSSCPRSSFKVEDDPLLQEAFQVLKETRKRMRKRAPEGREKTARSVCLEQPPFLK